MTGFSPIIEYDKPGAPIRTGPRSLLATTVETKRSILQDLRGRWKKTFQRIAVSTMTKDFGPFFPSNIEFDKPHGTFDKGPKGFLTITVEVIRSFP